MSDQTESKDITIPHCLDFNFKVVQPSLQLEYCESHYTHYKAIYQWIYHTVIWQWNRPTQKITTWHIKASMNMIKHAAHKIHSRVYINPCVIFTAVAMFANESYQLLCMLFRVASVIPKNHLAIGKPGSNYDVLYIWSLISFWINQEH